MEIYDLPNEMLAAIFEWLSEVDHSRCRQVSHFFRAFSLAMLKLDTNLESICIGNKGLSFQALQIEKRYIRIFSESTALGGRNELFKYLYRNGLLDWPSVIEGAALGGHLDLVKESVEQLEETFKECPHHCCTAHALGYASMNGHSEIFNYLLGLGFEEDGMVCVNKGAATSFMFQYGSLVDIKEFLRHQNITDLTTAALGAIIGGNIKALRYATEIFPEILRGKTWELQFRCVRDSRDYQAVIDHVQACGGFIDTSSSMCFACKMNSNKAGEYINLLLKNGATIDDIDRALDFTKNVPYSKLLPKLQIIEYLWERNLIADLNTVFISACCAGDEEAVSYILDHSKVLNWNAALVATCTGYTINENIINLLVALGADDWNDVLREACEHDSLKGINLALNQGANNFAIACAAACTSPYSSKETYNLLTERCQELDIDPICQTCGNELSAHY